MSSPHIPLFDCNPPIIAAGAAVMVVAAVATAAALRFPADPWQLGAVGWRPLRVPTGLCAAVAKWWMKTRG